MVNGKTPNEYGNSQRNLRNLGGFTLIELLLIILIISVLGATAIPIGSNSIGKNDLINKRNEITSLIKTAQLNSLVGKEDSKWGVYISADKITLFKGDTFVLRDVTFDENFSIPRSLTITPEEIVFSKLTGNPDTPTQINISSGTGENIMLSINEAGTIDVN